MNLSKSPPSQTPFSKSPLGNKWSWTININCCLPRAGCRAAAASYKHISCLLWKMVNPQDVLNKVTHEQEWQGWVRSIMQECRMLLWTLETGHRSANPASSVHEPWGWDQNVVLTDADVNYLCDWVHSSFFLLRTIGVGGWGRCGFGVAGDVSKVITNTLGFRGTLH